MRLFEFLKKTRSLRKHEYTRNQISECRLWRFGGLEISENRTARKAYRISLSLQSAIVGVGSERGDLTIARLQSEICFGDLEVC